MMTRSTHISRIVALMATIAAFVLASCARQPVVLSEIRSITGQSFNGKKYYFGFHQSDVGDPEMENEVKYDVEHTSNIFSSHAGGDYEASPVATSGSAVSQTWKSIGAKITGNDMYVQYSAGHGSPSGLAMGFSYQDIRDAVMAFPAKEIVVFTMSCYSGGLIDAFNNDKAQWSAWAASGRTLYVMSSSGDNEESSSGPGTDQDEPNGPDGSAGSAFGYSLWKALIGYADGYEDGVKDGFISLGEIQGFVTAKAQEVGGQTPAVTGVFNHDLIMNRVPDKTYSDAADAVPSIYDSL